ncbi:ABC transporter permease [Sagittula stellata]|uniref:ABC transporter permease protein n=1 Tax=Sagittula stellata (strain ATCC 700073 / DSM 11524 / E-37) TaxID=388399 RepID=A3K4D2_SAGS3|nr:ABC transporter permease [Sagittula stellata]EBA07831.1 ABC transporter permease protein [Sagittula stellata E-37]
MNASSLTLAPFRGLSRLVPRSAKLRIGGGLLVAIVLVAICAPLLTWHDPGEISPATRLRPPSTEFLLGTDMMGRDLWARLVYGGRVSLLVGLSVAVIATLIGGALGLAAGFIRALDPILMRITDGLMAIPSLLLAISLAAVSGGGLGTVIASISLAEMPRMVRVVRSVTLSLRETAFIDAAWLAGNSDRAIMFRHVLPNTLAPLSVQATFICASAMVTESILTFIGAGTPPSIPSWGNIMSDARALWQLKPLAIFAPAAALTLTILAVNMIGDGLRDHFDPKHQDR